VAVGEGLIAFVRPRDADLSSGQLQEHCASRLPRYMVPEEIKLLETMPHGSTGKIDRLVLQRMAKDG
jgi:acyl-coenzyme A synthetase/AMP-(fatty) acid ligase